MCLGMYFCFVPSRDNAFDSNTDAERKSFIERGSCSASWLTVGWVRKD